MEFFDSKNHSQQKSCISVRAVHAWVSKCAGGQPRSRLSASAKSTTPRLPQPALKNGALRPNLHRFSAEVGCWNANRARAEHCLIQRTSCLCTSVAYKVSTVRPVLLARKSTTKEIGTLSRPLRTICLETAPASMPPVH